MKKIILSIAFIMLLTVSCKNEKKSNTPTKKEEVKKEIVEEVKQEKTTTTDIYFDVHLKISGDDAMKFDKAELKVKAGQKVKLTLTHTGKMPKAAMGHNFVLLKKDIDIAKYAVKAIAAKDNGYIAPGSDALAYTKIIGGGESVTIMFTAPAKGTYDFICSFPGHYSIMKGKFIVE